MKLLTVTAATLTLLILALPARAAPVPRHWRPASWWLRQAFCIHHFEAVNWHEKRNPSSRGGMQFLFSTWWGVGGHGDPADAAPREQLYRAWLVWRRDGGSWVEWSTARLCHLR